MDDVFSQSRIESALGIIFINTLFNSFQSLQRLNLLEKILGLCSSPEAPPTRAENGIWGGGVRLLGQPHRPRSEFSDEYIWRRNGHAQLSPSSFGELCNQHWPTIHMVINNHQLWWKTSPPHCLHGMKCGQLWLFPLLPSQIWNEHCELANSGDSVPSYWLRCEISEPPRFSL